MKKEVSPGNEIIWFDSALFANFPSRWFDDDYWRQQGALTGQAGGRGTTYFFRHQGLELVLRHYRRGGLPGKLLADQYGYMGISRTRAWRELNLLLQLREQGLPVPRPVAARISRTLWYYRSDIVTQRIADARDLHAELQKGPLTSQQWQQVGRVIARFHRSQVYHHDLNIHNIMRDKQGTVWLIDFDKCSIKRGERFKQANLARLLRSLKKEKSRCSQYHFEPSDWQCLLAGYADSPIS